MEASFVATDCGAWRDAIDAGVAADVTRAIDQLAEFPVLDATVQRILQLCDEPDATTADLVGALERDQSFAVNLLRYANSAALARPIRAKTVRQAVMLVGRRALRRLSLEAATFRFLERAPGNGGTVRGQLHLHAVSVAVTSALAADMARVRGEAPHLAGLLHDIGKLVLPIAFGEEAIEDITREHPSGQGRVALERERLGIDHALAGALLAERWGCAPEVVEAIAFHHGGQTGIAVPTPEIACVQLANGVADMLSGGEADIPLLEAALAVLDLETSALDRLAEAASTPLGAVASGRLGEQIADTSSLVQDDDLTGLANRRHWLQTVRGELTERGSGAVLVVSVGGLADVTRIHGYGAANLVLTEVARVVSRHGLGGRIGGVVLGVWIDGGSEAALAASDQIMAEVAAAEREGAPAVDLHLGYACAPADGTDLALLLEAADAASARDRDAGRSRGATGRPGIEIDHRRAA
ncbi:MAG: HDOD domain-containing protein [Solirubrobacteraceae bacterium]|nr:HDOD domain-containing protein [Solirubrobacteraceae bacterium]